MVEPTINDVQTIAGDGGGTVLAGRYRVVRQLGQGGMGSVWLAEDTLLDNKPFAIKMLPTILVSNKRAYRQLKDEALVAMKLTHSNIVTLRAFEENNGNPFLVMDYVDGQTLDDLLAEKGKLSEEETVRILRPIAAALDYAHGEGVVHRDVKPANVMIRKDGHPFILDFGIAREIQETMTRVTGKLSSGTLLYMSPEQLNGEQPKPTQDIYSFAAMAYECLKGEPPFLHGQIEFQIMNKMPEPLDATSFSPKIGEVAGGRRGMTIAASVMAGLAKKPEDRPANCSGVLKMSSTAARVRAQPSAATPSSYPIGKLSAADAPSSYVKKPAPSHIPIASGLHRPGLGVGWMVFLAAALFVAAIVGGALWHREHLREQKRIDEQKAAERRSAERPREDAEAEKAAAQKRAFDIAAKAAATESRIEALVQKGRIERLSDANGFKSQKDSLADLFTRANALFDEKVQRWGESAQLFTNFVSQSKALVALDGARQSAIRRQKEAQDAFQKAERDGARTYAVTRWNAAANVWQQAVADFDAMRFASAEATFASLVTQFELCSKEAKRRAMDEAARLAAEKAVAERVAKQQEEDAKRNAEEDARRREAAKQAMERKLSRQREEGPISGENGTLRGYEPIKLNSLTDIERADGWELVWDGKTFDGWLAAKSGYKIPPEKGWIIQNGTLTMRPRVGIADGKWVQLPPAERALGGGGDIATVKMYRNFIFKFDFCLTKNACSGVKYFFNEKLNRATSEIYCIVEEGHPNFAKGQNGDRRTAALNDIYPAKDVEGILKGVGEWNSGMIVSKGNHIEHWLNGVKVLEFDRGTSEFRAAVNDSKYANWGVASDGSPQIWGETPEGRIVLLDNSDSTVSFRNLKIKELFIQNGQRLQVEP